MDLKELLLKFKVNESGHLDEGVQEELENYISEVVELKVADRAKSIVKEIADPVISEAKDELIREYEEKFDEYKEMITSKFSDFVDSILDEELEIPYNIKEYARKGELYSDIIDQLKIRIGIDEGALDLEARDLLSEAREEILKLRSEVNENEIKILDLNADGKEIAAELYIRQKCDGLTESQKTRAISLLEGIYDMRKIDDKFDFMCESLFEDHDGNKDNNWHNKKSTEKKCICPECGRETTIFEGSCSLYKCPDCEDTTLTDKTTDKTKKSITNENTNSGFESLIDGYTAILKEKKW